MYNIIKRLIPVSRYLLIIWVVLMIVSSSIPGLPAPKIETGSKEIRLDYIIHFIEYAGLAFLAVLSFTISGLEIIGKRLLYTGILLTIFAVADEFHQLLIPDRTFNPIDMVFNIAGIAAGLLLTVLLIKKIKP